jgi:hypothetical protein
MGKTPGGSRTTFFTLAFLLEKIHNVKEQFL